MLFSQYTTLSAADVAKRFGIDFTQGLNDKQVTNQRQKYGANTLSNTKNGPLNILLRQFHSPFLYLLGAAALFSLITKEFLDAGMIILFIILNTGLSFYQEYRSEKTVALLKKYVVSTTLVKRNGSIEQIPTHDIVVGDCVNIEAGDIIPTDIRLITADDFTVDESSITGETIAIQKTIKPLSHEAKQPYEAKNIAFAGTTVISGRATGVVIATGTNSFFGDISKLTSETKRVSNFEIEIQKISTFILRLIIVTLACVLGINLIWQHEAKNILELIIFAIALAVTVVPEALPVVTTFSLSRGSLRLAKHHVVVKRLSAIEDLGGIQILCTDKTGTLTENIMSVEHILVADSHTEAEILHIANLATPGENLSHTERQSSFESALWKAIPKHEQEKIRSSETLKHTPFDPVRLYSSTLVKNHSGYRIIVRGAPEVIIHHLANIPAKTKKIWNKWIEDEGKLGKRIIAIAYKELDSIPTDIHAHEEKLTCLGLISFHDPLKSSAKAAIQKAKHLGIQVKILSGDSKEVVTAVGTEVGLVTDDTGVITGTEIDELSEEHRLEAIENHSVFARVSPKQKYTIIQTLQKKYTVGFVGDGINDAPSLKIAQVGLAVHDAADVAREAADIVLLKQSLHVIIDGVEEGREVFANTLKYIKTTLAGSLGNFYTLSIATFLVKYLPMLPVQLLLVNLLTDFPMIAVATDTVDKNQIARPQTYNIQRIALFTTTLGIISTVFDFVFFGLFSQNSPEVLHTNWFIGSVLTELLLIFILRTRGPIWRARFPSTLMFGLAIADAALTILLPFTVFGQNVFEFVPPTVVHLGMIAGILALYVIANEFVKSIYYRFTSPEGCI